MRNRHSSDPRYSLSERAEMVETVVNGTTIAEVSRTKNVGIMSISRWVTEYLGYRGKEGITITIPSKIND